MKIPWVKLIAGGILALVAWAGTTIVDHGQKLAANAATLSDIDRRLERMEDLLIQLVRDKR